MEIDNDVWYSSSHQSIYPQSENGLVQYNTKTNQIINIFPYSENITPCRHFCCQYNKKIYIIDGEHGEIIVFDTVSKTYTKKLKIREIGKYPSAVVVFDKIHIFHGDQNDQHLIYDIKDNTIVEIKDKSALELMYGVSILKYQNKIIKFGGFCYYFTDEFLISNEIKPDSNDILEWDKYKLPKNLEMCGYILYKHYIVIFGGEGTGNKFTDTIYLLDLKKDFDWKEVKHIKCPMKSKYVATVTADNMVHLFTEINKVTVNWRESARGYYLPISTIFDRISKNFKYQRMIAQLKMLEFCKISKILNRIVQTQQND